MHIYTEFYKFVQNNPCMIVNLNNGKYAEAFYLHTEPIDKNTPVIPYMPEMIKGKQIRVLIPESNTLIEVNSGHPLENHPDWTLINNVPAVPTNYGWELDGLRIMTNKNPLSVQNLNFKGLYGQNGIISFKNLCQADGSNNYHLPASKFIDENNLIGFRHANGRFDIVQRFNGSWDTLESVTARRVVSYEIEINGSTIVARDADTGEPLIAANHSITDAGYFGISSHNHNCLDGSVYLVGYDVYVEGSTPPPSGIPTDGLINQWLFNGNSNDDIGGLNGTDTDVNYVNDRLGNANAAASFNGSTSNVTLPDYRLELPFSISLWVTHDAIPTVTGAWYISNRDNSLNDYFQIFYLLDDNTISCSVYDPNGEIEAIQSLIITTDLPSVGEVRHYVITVEQNEVVTYTNGTETNRYTVDLSIWPTDNTFFTFGMASWSGRNFFEGTLDDIRIYNRILTQEEVTALYNEGGYTP